MRVYGLVNLSALHHNLSVARQHAPLTRVMAVVKKDAYGFGLTRVAKSLQSHVDGFAVASIEEGIDLREADVSKPICVLSGFFSSKHLEPLQAYGLDPVIYCDDQLEILNSKKIHHLNIWLKFDTGMNRLGFAVENYREALAKVKENRALRVDGLMTHFACADDLESDFTNVQINEFERCSQNWDKKISLANSAGILRWPKSRVGWIRPGLLLYGASPFEQITSQELGLKPVMELYSTILAVKDLERGSGVGYGLTWKNSKKSKIAIVAAGYGDGIHRIASDKTCVLIGKRRAQQVGRISMDSFAVDITDIPEANVGTKVKLFGTGLPVEELASSAGTIPYEIFTNLNPRTVSVVEV